MSSTPAAEVGKVIVNLPTSDYGDDGKNTQKKHWCFTWFNVKNPPVCNAKEIDYMVYQLEKCPTNGHLHLQGYVETKNRVSWNQMSKIFRTNHFWRKGRNGPRDKARAYCMYEFYPDDWWEVGLRGKRKRVEGTAVVEVGEWKEVGQGRRSDLLNAIELKNIEEIKEHYPDVYVKYHGGLKSLFGPKYITGNRTWKPDIWVYWGPTGTGKTHSAFAKGGDTAFVKPGPGKWWDGYGGDEVVIWEEFRGCNNEWRDSDLLRLLDKRPMKVETKGGWVDMLAKMIIFTSPNHPSGWLTNKEDEEQLLRRIPKDQIIHLNERRG